MSDQYIGVAATEKQTNKKEHNLHNRVSFMHEKIQKKNLRMNGKRKTTKRCKRKKREKHILCYTQHFALNVSSLSLLVGYIIGVSTAHKQTFINLC